MEISATIQQQFDHFASRSGHASMQRCPSSTVTEVQELRLGVEERLHPPYITRGRGHVDRVISLGWLDSAATGASLFKQLDHVWVAPISGNGEQLFAAVCTRIEQNLRRIEVSFAHREVERLVV